uniref:DUF4773 domain-containing protein n=1 Tax=Magallana gigas TaxID=29159 RepID=K1RDG1_MAGGI
MGRAIENSEGEKSEYDGLENRFIEENFNYIFDHKLQNVEEEPNGCSCVGYTCGCCQHLEVDKIGLNDTVCINVKYLDQDYGLEVTLSVDGHVYINASISARNPPPLCAAIPGLKDLASICLQFYNLNVNSTSFSGCMRVVAKLKYVTVDKINIGCFKIPPSKSGARTVPKVQSKEFLAFVEKYMQAKRSDYKWLDLKKFDVRSLK